MPEFTDKDGQLLDLALSHGLIFPQAFKDRVRDAILDGLRNVNYKNIPGMGVIRGKKFLQLSGTVGVFSNSSGGVWEHMSQSDIGTHADVIIRGIADGKYLILWSVQISVGASPGGQVGLSINGATPATPATLQSHSSNLTFARAFVATLKNSDNNSIEVMAMNGTAGSMIIDYPSITLIKIADQ